MKWPPNMIDQPQFSPSTLMLLNRVMMMLNYKHVNINKPTLCSVLKHLLVRINNSTTIGGWNV